MKTSFLTRLSDSRKRGGAKIVLLLSTVLWGSSYFILKDTLDEVPPYFLLTFRFLVSAVLLGLICFKKWKLMNVTYLWQGVLTGVFLAFAYIFQTLGLQNTTPGTSAFLTTVYCILVPFIGWAVMKRRPTLLNLAAAVVCMAGIGLVCMDGGSGGFSMKGEGYTLICGVFFALQIVAVDKFGQKLDTFLFTTIQFFTAFVICLVFFLAKESMPTSLSPDSAFSLVYVGVMATCVCFVMMNVGIKYASSIAASLILSLEGVFGVAFSMIFYHERLTLQVGMGFAVIFVALLLNEVLPKLIASRRDAAFPSVRPRKRTEVYRRERCTEKQIKKSRPMGRDFCRVGVSSCRVSSWTPLCGRRRRASVPRRVRSSRRGLSPRRGSA